MLDLAAHGVGIAFHATMRVDIRAGNGDAIAHARHLGVERPGVREAHDHGIIARLSRCLGPRQRIDAQVARVQHRHIHIRVVVDHGRVLEAHLGIQAHGLRAGHYVSIGDHVVIGRHEAGTHEAAGALFGVAKHVNDRRPHAPHHLRILHVWVRLFYFLGANRVLPRRDQRRQAGLIEHRRHSIGQRRYPRWRGRVEVAQDAGIAQALAGRTA